MFRSGALSRLTPLLAALLLVYSGLQAHRAQAEDVPASSQNTIPDLGQPSARTGNFSIRPNGATLDNRFDGKHLLISPEYSDQTGLSLGGTFAFPLGDSAAGGLLVTAGDKKNELLFNAGFQLDDFQRLILTLGQLRQTLDIGFISGSEPVDLTQTSGAVSYQRYLGKGLLNSFEVNGYLADTPSRDLTDKTHAIDTATLYELWNDPRRVAGGRITGLQGKLVFTPLPDSTFKLGAGGERMEYDYFTGMQSTTRATGSAEWRQQLAAGLNLKAGADAAAAQNRYTVGLEGAYVEGWKLGVNLTGIRGKDGAPDDNQIELTWSYGFGGKASASAASPDSTSFHPGYTPSSSPDEARNPGTSAAWGSLLDQVAQRPTFIPAQVVAKLDTTAVPVRLIAVDKTALPAGSSVNPATGVITTPLGIVAAGIAGVTLNGGGFANSGQFALSGNSLVTDPNKITQPAVGVTDTYVVTVNISGGGTTLVTVLVSHGSVKVDSITIGGGDVIAPTTTAALSVSGTTDTATTLSATINENGTGYYLVQAAAAAAPTVAAVQAGTAFAMTANVAVSQNISGLTASTPYKIYFVAKDAANNVWATAQSVAVTTSAAPAAPTASAVAITGTAQVGQTLTGHYSYADANGDPQGASTFRWLRNGAAIAGATASTYTLDIADQNKTITFEVTPVATAAPTTGTPVVSSATAAVASNLLPAGYISLGGLTWTPNTIGSAFFGGDYNHWGISGGYASWTNANTYCTNTTINGQTGWRLPTTAELSALYASGALAGAPGWALNTTWSSTPHGAGNHESVRLSDGGVGWGLDMSELYVSCVR